MLQFFTKKTDIYLVSAIIFLLGIGAVVLFAIDEGAVNAIGFSPLKHVAHIAIGVTLAALVLRTNSKVWYAAGVWLYGLSIILLIAVLFTSAKSGSSRWIELGFMQFQPSELAKVSLILLLSRFFSRRSGKMNNLFNIGLSILYTLIPTALVLMQPDLGTALVFVAIWLTMLLVSNIDIKYILLGCLLMVIGGFLAVPRLEAYQKQRLFTFLDPAADTQGAGYNVRQASIAIGSGQIFGQGLDSGSQGRLNFLPAQHTDFIFAATAEKLGYIGAISVIMAYGIIVVRLFVHGARLQSSFGAHVCLGVAVLFAFHIVINIGMNLGLVPVTGLPLPFLSYGGTHLITMMFAIAIVLTMLKNRKSLDYA